MPAKKDQAPPDLGISSRGGSESLKTATISIDAVARGPGSTASVCGGQQGAREMLNIDRATLSRSMWSPSLSWRGPMVRA
jgi:hypothetical protein